jgi:histone H2A
MAKGAKGGKGKNGQTSTNKTRSQRAGLVFPVGRVHRQLKEGKYIPRVSGGAAVFMTAVIEYLTSEITELAGLQAKIEFNKKRIVPRHIFLGIKDDHELNALLGDFAIAESGHGRPCLHPFLLPKSSLWRKMFKKKK